MLHFNKKYAENAKLKKNGPNNYNHYVAYFSLEITTSNKQIIACCEIAKNAIKY